MQDGTHGPPPMPPGMEDARRVEEAARRVAILEGTWGELLRAHVVKQLRARRASMVGMVDISSNLLKQFVTQVSTLYAQEPMLRHADAAGLTAMQEQLKKAKVWQLAQRHQRYVLGINESLMSIGWCEHRKHVVARMVCPSHVWCEPGHDDSMPGALHEARVRKVHADGGRMDEQWVWDVWDIREPDEDHPDRPSFRVFDLRGRDITQQFVDVAEWTGKRYPYKDAAGQPVMPYVLYHASPHNGMWAEYDNSEVVFGTLQDALNWTNCNHAFMRASWDQRFVAGGRIAGASPKRTADGGDGQVVSQTTDPTTVTRIISDGDGPVNVGQWGAAVDIDKAERFCRNYGARLAVHFGLSPADVVFEPRSPASGVSIKVSRAGLRELQAWFAPQFKMGDKELLRVISVVAGVYGVKLPSDGYDIVYGSVALSSEERKDVLAVLETELRLGLVTKADAWRRLNPGATEQEAQAAVLDVLTEISQEQKAITGGGGAEPLQPPTNP